jgi:adenine phosphoribosyltransferase
MTDHRLQQMRDQIRAVPDFPKPGILFRDMTPLLGDPPAFNATIDLLVERLASVPADAIVAIESRGFIFGAALAARMRLPFVPVRKPGKLPARTVRVEYALEYGTDALEMHVDAFGDIERARVIIVDDLLATGGTASAAARLVTMQGGVVQVFAFVVELAFLKGIDRLRPTPVIALLGY